jgi:hypothetical protein
MPQGGAPYRTPRSFALLFLRVGRARSTLSSPYRAVARRRSPPWWASRHTVRCHKTLLVPFAITGPPHWGACSAELNLKKCSKAFSSKFAASSSVVGKDEVLVQGDISDDVTDFITMQWPEVSSSLPPLSPCCPRSHFCPFPPLLGLPCRSRRTTSLLCTRNSLLPPSPEFDPQPHLPSARYPSCVSSPRVRRGRIQCH